MSLTVDVHFRAGEFSLSVDLKWDGPLTVIGPNGGGKTTLLRLLMGAAEPESGRISLGERVFAEPSKGIWAPPEARGVGYVPQGFALFPNLNVEENVGFALRKLEAADRRERVTRLLERLECMHLAGRSVVNLSGGEKQRVALARALAAEPEVLLLDEPLSSLDAVAKRSVRTLLADVLAEFDGPSVWVTHDVRDARVLDSDVCVLQGGAVAQLGALSELESDPATEFVAEFVGS